MIRVAQWSHQQGGGLLPAAARNAHRSWPDRRGLLVTITDDFGHVGFGEASPLPGYSPDTLRQCQQALEIAALPRYLPESVLEAWQRLDPTGQFSRLPALRCALETAVLDLLGHRTRTPAWRLLLAASGEKPDPGPRGLARLVTSCDPGVAADEARSAMEEGYASIKVKVGGQPLEDDMRVVFKVAEAAADVNNSQRTGARVRVDANRAWEPETATQVLTALRTWGIEFVEEPVAGGQWSKLAGCSVPLAADESLAQGYTVTKLASLGVRTVVLKPTVLGLSRSVALAKAARSLGMTVVVSHTFDGKVAYAAAAALALAVGSSDVATGLGPHAGLAAWPGEMPLALDASRLVPTAAPGLGIPRPERLQVQIR